MLILCGDNSFLHLAKIAIKTLSEKKLSEYQTILFALFTNYFSRSVIENPSVKRHLSLLSLQLVSSNWQPLLKERALSPAHNLLLLRGYPHNENPIYLHAITINALLRYEHIELKKGVLWQKEHVSTLLAYFKTSFSFLSNETMHLLEGMLSLPFLLPLPDQSKESFRKEIINKASGLITIASPLAQWLLALLSCLDNQEEMHFLIGLKKEEISLETKWHTLLYRNPISTKTLSSRLLPAPFLFYAQLAQPSIDDLSFPLIDRFSPSPLSTKMAPIDPSPLSDEGMFAALYLIQEDLHKTTYPNARSFSKN